jgi:hypothetical protein
MHCPSPLWRRLLARPARRGKWNSAATTAADTTLPVFVYRTSRGQLWAAGGGMFSNKDSIGAPMEFLDSDPAFIRTLVDDKAFVGGIEFGIDAGERVDVSVGYEAYVGSQVESHTANVKVRIAF